MPLYEYKCDKCAYCHQQIESWVQSKQVKLCCKINEDLSVCEGKMIKQISRASFSLQGGGWASSGYSTKQITKEK